MAQVKKLCPGPQGGCPAQLALEASVLRDGTVSYPPIKSSTIQRGQHYTLRAKFPHASACVGLVLGLCLWARPVWWLRQVFTATAGSVQDGDSTGATEPGGGELAGQGRRSVGGPGTLQRGDNHTEA